MCRTMRGQVWAETPPVHNHLVLRKKGRNWQNAEVRQPRKPTCKKKGLQSQTVKKGDVFYFTECQNKSDSLIEKANQEPTSVTEITLKHSHKPRQKLAWGGQGGRGVHRKRQEKTEFCRWDIGFNEEGPRPRTV